MFSAGEEIASENFLFLSIDLFPINQWRKQVELKEVDKI